MSRSPVVTLVVVLLVSACQTPMNKGSQCVVPEGYLAAANTFAWHLDSAVDVDDRTGYVSPIVAQGLAKAVAGELAGKGFSQVDMGASDVTVALTLRTRRELISMTINDSPCASADCWERIDPGSSTRMDMRTIGFLAADVYFQGEPIWRGWVERTLFPQDRDNTAVVIGEAIPVLFETFPP